MCSASCLPTLGGGNDYTVVKVSGSDNLLALDTDRSYVVKSPRDLVRVMPRARRDHRSLFGWSNVGGVDDGGQVGGGRGSWPKRTHFKRLGRSRVEEY